MANLKTVLYCEGINADMTPNGPKNTLVGPLMCLAPMFIPGMFSFSIFVHIEDIGEVKDLAHSFKIIFKKKNSQEEIVNTGDQPININKGDQTEENKMNGIMINMDFRNVVIREEGEYVSEIYFDNEKIGEGSIYAKAVENNGLCK